MRKPTLIRVASVPAGHPYVIGLGLADAGIVVLEDPPVPGAPPGRWWPPQMLGSDWIMGNRERFDVMHIHFGVESLSLTALATALDALRDACRPLVYTAHDLTHPQLYDQAHHEAQLKLLSGSAAELITLTPGAAAELARRFGRRATVIPHPAMRAPGPPPTVAAASGAAPLVGVHLRDLRPSVEGPHTVGLLAAALRALPGVRGRVHLHPETRDPDAAAAVVDACAATPRIELLVEPRPDDVTLERQLAELSVSLLPYRHGTHSGWVELCADLGVPVAAPRLGYLAEQHGAIASFRREDAADLGDALRSLLAQPSAVPGSAARLEAVRVAAQLRIRDRPRLSAAHRAVYRRAISEMTISRRA